MRGCCEALFVVLAILGLAIPAAHGEEDAGGAPFGALSERAQSGPITIKSDSLELDYREATLTYVGNVHVTQGDMVLTSDILAITFHQGALAGVSPTGEKQEPGRRVSDRIREIVADGNVRIEQEQRVATGKRAVFDHAQQTIVLSDNAVLEEGPNQVSGERIVVYLDEQRSVIESGSNTRVQAVLYPGTVDEEALAAAKTPPEPDTGDVAATPLHEALADSGAPEPPSAGDGLP